MTIFGHTAVRAGSVRADAPAPRRSSIRNAAVGGAGALLLAAFGSPAAAGPPTFQQIGPNVRTYVFAQGGDYTQYFGPIADITAALDAVALTFPPTPTPTSTSGCSAADFVGFTPGSIALMQRGGCSPGEKAINAAAAGAVGALVFNEGQVGRTEATLFSYAGFMPTIPTFNLSYAQGHELAMALSAGPVTLRMMTDERYFEAPQLSAVPEPAVWSMMICGFALVGAGLRSARPRRAPAGARLT